MRIKLNLTGRQSLPKEKFQPGNWIGKPEDPKAVRTRQLGYLSGKVHPIPDIPEAKELRERNLKDIEGQRVCFDQKTYNTYAWLFDNSFVGDKPVLLEGPPGTCKTFVSCLMAAEVGIPLLKISALDVDPARARKILFGGLTTTSLEPWALLRDNYKQGALTPEQTAVVQAMLRDHKEPQTEHWKNAAAQLGMKDGVAHNEMGVITKALKHGYCVFVDEVNRFSGPALADLVNLLSGQSVPLENGGGYISMKDKHPNARLVFAQNPAGPKHPDRIPLSLELRSRIPRTLVVSPLTETELAQFAVHEFCGVQPLVQTPSGESFTAVQSQNDLAEFSGGSFDELETFCRKLVEAHDLVRRETEKMESQENAGNVQRVDTIETRSFDRRVLGDFISRTKGIMSMEAPREVIQHSFQEAFKDFYLGHFPLYNENRGHETAVATLAMVQNLQLFEAFDGLMGKLEMLQQKTVDKPKEAAKPQGPATAKRRALDDRLNRLAGRFAGAEQVFWHKDRNLLVLVSPTRDHPGVHWTMADGKVRLSIEPDLLDIEDAMIRTGQLTKAQVEASEKARQGKVKNRMVAAEVSPAHMPEIERISCLPAKDAVLDKLAAELPSLGQAAQGKFVNVVRLPEYITSELVPVLQMQAQQLGFAMNESRPNIEIS